MSCAHTNTRRKPPSGTKKPKQLQKKLIVLSRQWPQHKAGVFDRLKETADKEDDVDKKMALRRLFRTLQGVRHAAVAAAAAAVCCPLAPLLCVLASSTQSTN